MDWVPVDGSSRVRRVAFDEAARRVVVEFPDGTLWGYEAGPLDYGRLLVAPSKGRFIRGLESRRNGRYTPESDSEGVGGDGSSVPVR